MFEQLMEVGYLTALRAIRDGEFDGELEAWGRPDIGHRLLSCPQPEAVPCSAGEHVGEVCVPVAEPQEVRPAHGWPA
jgi:hypothetical protein